MSENTPAQAENTPTSVPETQNPKTTDVAALDERAYHEMIQALDPNAIPAKEEAQAEPEQQAPVAEAQEPKEEEVVKEDEAKEEAKPEEELDTALPERVRIGSWSKTEREALQLRARNPDLTLEQAMSMVKGKDGSDSPAPVEPTPEEIEAKIDAKAQEKANAMKSLEFDKAAQLELEMADLAKAYRRADKVAVEKEAIQKVARAEETESAKRLAVDTYPDTANKDSVLTKKMYEIFDILQDTKNPLVNDPNLPIRLAQMAANELGIAPRGKAQAKVPSPSVARRSQPTIQPASGNARTNTPQPINAKDVLSKIEDVEQFRALMASL
jgi:hypothetical protein